MTTYNVHIGVDVGGTNTDAVVIKEGKVIGWTKCTTTDDVTCGVRQAVYSALKNATADNTQLRVQRIHIGTTHFVNAVVERRQLAKVAVIRLCGPASTDLPPFTDFPTQLMQVIGGPVYLLDGGYHFDGRIIREIRREEILETIQDLKKKNITNVVVSGVFSPIVNDQEVQVSDLLKTHYPECSFTLSHEIAHLGILMRENAAILNECLKPLSRRTITAFQSALQQLGLDCPFYLTQNDGTLISAEESMRTPVYTFASGTTNSMRGAAFLSGVKNAVVVDIGGTTTDFGMLVGGFPRPATTKVKVGGVNTNFRMPDVLSIGLGGGSLVTKQHNKVRVGPQSVGNLLEKKAMVFGGDVLTASDIAVAAQLSLKMGTATHSVNSLDQQFVSEAAQTIREMVEDMIDQCKISSEEVPVILVGGGSVLIDSCTPLKGSCRTLVPDYHQVANAVGAALSQVAGSVDTLEDLAKVSRETAIENAKVKAISNAIAARAIAETVEVVDVMEVPLTYVPGNVTRVRVRAVGDLQCDDHAGCVWDPDIAQPPSAPAFEEKVMGVGDHDENEIIEREPTIDAKSGEWILSEWDVECIAIGAGILGCGGGGNPHNGKLLALRNIRHGKPIRIITPERLSSRVGDGLVVPLGLMGAPTILDEVMFTNEPCHAAVLAMCKARAMIAAITLPDVPRVKGLLYMDDLADGSTELDSDVVALLCAEIGGANSMTALVEGAVSGLPVLDADCMGRAFPELQHVTPLIYGHTPYPATLGSIEGQRAAVLYVDSPKHLENHFRQVCVDMGCIAGFVLNPVELAKLPELHIPYSYSRAWHLGRAVLHARANNLPPVQTILSHEGGRMLMVGKINDVQRKTEGGFARGLLKIAGFGEYDSKTMLINFQNENLTAKITDSNGSEKLVACVPDLISLVCVDSGQPLATEEARYGLRVAILHMAAPALLRTARALEVVGPSAFGYSVEYTPLGERTQCHPVGPT